MEDGCEWTPKDRKTEKDDVIRKYIKEKQVKIEEAQDRRTWRLKTRCADRKIRQTAQEEEYQLDSDGYIGRRMLRMKLRGNRKRETLKEGAWMWRKGNGSG